MWLPVPVFLCSAQDHLGQNREINNVQNRPLYMLWQTTIQVEGKLVRSPKPCWWLDWVNRVKEGVVVKCMCGTATYFTTLRQRPEPGQLLWSSFELQQTTYRYYIYARTYIPDDRYHSVNYRYYVVLQITQHERYIEQVPQLPVCFLLQQTAF